MSELSNAIGGSAPKHTLTANGKTYTVGLITQGVKIAYEKALYHKARERIKSLGKEVDDEDRTAMTDRIMTAYEDGDFGILGTRGRKILATPAGVTVIMALLMEVEEHDVLQILLDNEEDTQAVFKTVLSESFPGVKFPFVNKPEANGEPQGPKAQGESSPAPSG